MNRRAGERPYYKKTEAAGLAWLVGLAFVSGSMMGATLALFFII